MSFTEILKQVEDLTEAERKQLMMVLREAEQQDKQKVEELKNANGSGQFATIFDVASDIIGSVESEFGDLSINKNYMEGFGRDRNRNY